MGSITGLVIGIVIGAAIVGIIIGLIKLACWCSDVSFKITCLETKTTGNWKKCSDLNETCESLLEHGTEVLKTFASVHERLTELEDRANGQASTLIDICARNDVIDGEKKDDS